MNILTTKILKRCQRAEIRENGFLPYDVNNPDLIPRVAELTTDQDKVKILCWNFITIYGGRGLQRDVVYLLTNSAFVSESKCGGWGGLRGS